MRRRPEARIAALLVLGAMFVACARERVEVADVDATSADDGGDPSAPPPFASDAAADVTRAPGCGEPPSIGRCPPCAKGYVVVVGASTCDCCP